MPAASHQLVVSPDARQDISDILFYTEQQWGKRQRIAYRAILNKAIATIRANPFIGVARPMLLPDIRAFPIERHILYYRLIDKDGIEIARILDERVDATRHLR